MSEREMISRSHPENEAIRRETVKWQQAANKSLSELQRENEALRAENVQLLLELDMQQATILVPSQKDDQRRIERLDAALKEALDEAAALRAQIYRAEKAYIRLDASMNKLKAAFRVNMIRAFPNMSHEEIDVEIEDAIWESGE